MTKADYPQQPPAQRSRVPPRLLGILVVLALSVLLHLVFIDWVGGAVGGPQADTTNTQTIVTTIIKAPSAPAIAPPVAEAPKKPKPKPRIRTVQSPPPEIKVPSETVEPEAPTAVVATDDAASNAAIPIADASAVTPQPAPTQEQNPPRYRISLPPSADLKYDVQKIAKEGQPMYGRGSINWQTDGTHYTVDGDAGVLFFTLLNFKSEGTVDANGIAPEIYSEKKFRKSETATHFHRERNTISFSSSTKSYPRNGGEQDRASVVWQLAGIGRGDASKFSAGTQIDVTVAGTRDADTWSMVVVGQEEIHVAGENIQAWHVTRVPRAGSYDQKLDIWFAPQQNWYPVRLRYTETNGDFLDMSLTSLNILPTPLSDP